MDKRVNWADLYLLHSAVVVVSSSPGDCADYSTAPGPQRQSSGLPACYLAAVYSGLPSLKQGQNKIRKTD